MNNFVFSTKGSWATTFFTNKNQPFDVRRIYIQGKVTPLGFSLERYDLVVPKPFLQEKIDNLINEGFVDECYDHCENFPIFPGSIDFIFSKGSFTIENSSMEVNLTSFKFYLDGIEVTDYITKINIEIDSITNLATAWFSYKLKDNQTDVSLI